MIETSHKHVRDARDRLIDMLGIGKTFPLRDLDVRDERLMVPINATAKVPIEISQSDVLYSLYTRDDKPVHRAGQVPAESKGNGGTLILETPTIVEDITYKIRAAKIRAAKPDMESITFLHQSATVKVGLDVSLEAEILNAELLDPAIESPAISDPRIVDYGSRAEVEIKESQEGVDYRLVAFEEKNGDAQPVEVGLSDETVRGTRGDILLHSRAVHEDTDIRIRATKTFDSEEGRPDQTDLLEVVLPLKVRANPTNKVTVAPANIIDYRQSAVVKIADSQVGAKYRIYHRVIPDRDVIHREVPDADVIKVSVPDEPDVQIRKPALPSVWQALEVFMPGGDFKPGNGGELQLQLDGLTDDSLIIVKALKGHLASMDGPDAPKIPSAVPLQQSVVFLVRPDPAPGLKLTVPVQGDKTSGTIRVDNGQPGVFYFFRRTPQGKDLNLPAYFHKRDNFDKSQNKGLDQLKLKIDFVVAADPPAGSVGAADNPAKIFPQPPLLETGPLKTDSSLHIRAVKAQTRVKKALDLTAQIGTLPEIRPEQATVNSGSTARIQVLTSKAGDRYQLTLNGEPVKKARNGNGADLVFITGPLTQDTTFEMMVTRPQEAGIAVERVVRLPVLVETTG